MRWALQIISKAGTQADNVYIRLLAVERRASWSAACSCAAAAAALLLAAAVFSLKRFSRFFMMRFHFSKPNFQLETFFVFLAAAARRGWWLARGYYLSSSLCLFASLCN